MSISKISNNNSDLTQLLQNSKDKSASPEISGTDADSFKAALKVRMAEVKSQTFGMLLSANSAAGSVQGTSNLGGLLGSDSGSSDPLAALLGNTGTSASVPMAGRNMSLSDPESAYQMMTVINSKEVNYKAEFAVMGDMKAYLAKMEQEGKKLQNIDASTSNEEIQTRLQSFADAYNGWIQRFDEDLQAGGILAGTQAAHVAQWEMEQSIEYYFNGARDGLHGMGDLGFSIDPITNLASVDTTELNAVLANNKSGAINTVQEFSGNFAKSAELLNSEGNFIRNRMDNLARVIDYIETNKQSLQADFGLGDAAKPNSQVAKALAEYNALQDKTG